MSAVPLFGEAGKRVERVEWGIRYPKGHVLVPGGGVDLCQSEEHARTITDRPAYGMTGVVVVSRTVVTYTTAWSPS